ncbi:fatty acid desaturase-domain-containing protein [Phlyctochytrium arcticum]|nr:fatty acid desaturase-domain-containing protein [Phlyctochytrium arcticum]
MTAMGAGPRQFTWAEIEKSAPKSGKNATNLTSPAYVVIHGKVYDLSTGFFNWHPGGGVAFSQLGMDASGAFEVFHREQTSELLANFYAGDLAVGEIRKDSGFMQDVQEIRALIEKNGWLESSKLWYAANVGATLSIAISAIALIAMYGDNVFAILLSACMIGIFWQQCGWLAHDFLHNQVFLTNAYNDYAGYLIGNVFQGFSVSWWKHKHCTHHSVPNVHSGDPDIDTLPFLAWSEHALEGFADVSDAGLAKFLVAYQPILYFPLLSVARLNWAISSLMWCTRDLSTSTQVFPLRKVVELAGLALHWAWYLGAAFLFLSPLSGLLWFAVSQAVCGVLLAAVFSVNHNGMPIYSQADAAKLNFYQLSILTGRDVYSNVFSDWFTGGLNLQIEHHMFPNVPRHNLKYIVPHVRKLCVKHNVPFHETSIVEGLVEVVDRLATVSKQARKTHVL